LIYEIDEENEGEIDIETSRVPATKKPTSETHGVLLQNSALKLVTGIDYDLTNQSFS
jgi:hypothetical protein